MSAHDEIEDSSAPLMEHLTELRSRLIYSVLAFIGGMIISFIVWNPVFNFLTEPLCDALSARGQTCDLQFIALEEGFFVAISISLLGGLVLCVFERSADAQPDLRKDQITFVAMLSAVVIVSIGIMRFAGPAAAEFTNMFRNEPIEYRLLRATPGWKHIGFILGGVTMVSGIVAIVEHRLSSRAVLTGIVAVLVLIAVFDLPFEDLLLPPNGDV